MATVVCVWELGANLGHLGNLKQIATRALRDGHCVWIIAKDLANVHTVFGDIPVRVLQAPAQRLSPSAKVEDIQSFPQLIANSCYRNIRDLLTYLSAWKSNFDLTKPDLVFYDHSPLALAASWGFNFKKVLVGNGFTLPPVQTPLLGVFPDLNRMQIESKLEASEANLLADISECFKGLNYPAIRQLADIYRQAHHVVRFTIPELDHFFERPIGPYVGVWPSFGCAKPMWKNTKTYKVFAYLQSFKGLSRLLEQLASSDVEVLVYCPTLSSAEKSRLSSLCVTFITDPVDLFQVAESADFGITHGNHDTTVQLSLLGLPLMTIPRHQEQFFLAVKHRELGLGEIALQDQSSFSAEITKMINNAAYRKRALALRDKYSASSTLTPGSAIDNILIELQ